MNELAAKIDALLAAPPYALPPREHQEILLALLKDELDYARFRNPHYRNYLEQWPVDSHSAREISDLPYLPVRLLKRQPPLSLVEPNQIQRILMSSATTGQIPSRVALDLPTSRRMTKGVAAIVRDFIGSTRRPYLVVDVPASAGGGAELGARGAAIRGLQPFASEMVYCLDLDPAGNLLLDRERLELFIERHRGLGVLVYGFTYILWKYFVQPLLEEGVSVSMPDVHILHSGGWKRLEAEAVDKQTFNEGLARVFGASPDRVIDFYGMVENVGVIYPDCAQGNKHVPAFADVLVRDPLTLEPVQEGERGIVQVCSVLPTSFPGHLLLTEDLAEVVAYDGCRCGRRGISFRFAGRVPKAEVRGCGNIEWKRSAQAGLQVPA
jgi:phenylacetate-coenzyme A ligase PaaK-like adenylate-forming protein